MYVEQKIRSIHDDINDLKRIVDYIINEYYEIQFDRFLKQYHIRTENYLITYRRNSGVAVKNKKEKVEQRYYSYRNDHVFSLDISYVPNPIINKLESMIAIHEL